MGSADFGKPATTAVATWPDSASQWRRLDVPRRFRLGPQSWCLASQHAKCLVVDRRWALVSSANFTERGLTRNLEAGVLIEDATFARRLSEQWLVLIDSGQMKPYRPK